MGNCSLIGVVLVTLLLYFSATGSKEQCDKEKDKEINELEEDNKLPEKGDKSSDKVTLLP